MFSFFIYFADFCSLFLLNFLIDTKSFSVVIMKLFLRFFDQEPNRKLHLKNKNKVEEYTLLGTKY